METRGVDEEAEAEAVMIAIGAGERVERGEAQR